MKKDFTLNSYYLLNETESTGELMQRIGKTFRKEYSTFNARKSSIQFLIQYAGSLEFKHSKTVGSFGVLLN
ncbi:MAG: hypothetical protein Q8T08_20475 [Ignavibacteria bacterium]|nr:hypothetical protein [Ignavibacteria bacterium]